MKIKLLQTRLTIGLIVLLLAAMSVACTTILHASANPAASGSMTAKHNKALPETEIRSIITQYFDKMQALDLEPFMLFFAPDSILEDPVGRPPIRGRAAIREFAGNMWALLTPPTITLHDIYVGGNEAAVHWTVQATTRSGQEFTVTGIDVFVFNEQGQIQSAQKILRCGGVGKGLERIRWIGNRCWWQPFNLAVSAGSWPCTPTLRR